MLSSRLALGVGTLSIVAVTSLSTALLVTDGTQRLAEPLAAAPRPTAPTFKSPPLVVPETPGTIVANPVGQRPAAPRVRVVVPRRAVAEPVPAPIGAPTGPAPGTPATGAPVTEKPSVGQPAPYPPLVATPLPGKGKHLGQLKAAARDDARGKDAARAQGERGPAKR